MRSRLLLSLAGLAIGLGIAAYPRTSEAFVHTVTCGDICALAYQICVNDRGLKAGCGREQRQCLRTCAGFSG